MNKKPIKILAFAGSTRHASFNKKLARIACQLAADAGADTTYIDLKVYPMPLFDQDLEKEITLPESAIKIRSMMQRADGFLISAPEYNSSISAVLKNTIDWCSRQQANEEPLICFKNKVIGLLSASPGRLGGLRGLVTVRSVLTTLGSIVIPTQVAIPTAHEKFTEDGYLIEDREQAMVENLVTELMAILNKLRVSK